MTLTIGYLYYDLMNLYGESGNIKALKNELENQGIKVIIKKLSIDDEIDFKRLDFIYMGTGTKNNMGIVLNDLKKYKKEIENAIKDDKFFLITGNAVSLFSKENFKLFSYEIINQDKRYVGEVVKKCGFINKDIYGFYNHDGMMINNTTPLFQDEGFLYNNFYATFIIGPILIRNPEFLKYIIKKLIKTKDINFKFKRFNLKLEEQAYQEFIKFKERKK